MLKDAVTGAAWAPYNSSAEKQAIYELTDNYTAALRELAPNTGCYLNEVSHEHGLK